MKLPLIFIKDDLIRIWREHSVILMLLDVQTLVLFIIPNTVYFTSQLSFVLQM